MRDRGTETSITFRAPLLRGALEACLVHIYPVGPQMGRRYPLGSTPVVLGRGEGTDIRIDDGSVSRKHAKVEPTTAGYEVSDLQSTNGTFVNDRATSAPRLLRDGDYVRVGNCIYRYLAGGNIEAEYHEEIYRLTIMDGLTQVHNRRSLHDFLERELARSQRHRRPLAVMMVDIDRFKSINDTHGHLTGDAVLRDLTQVIKQGVRREDLIARYGGEEFCLVLVETDPDGARETAERLRKRVEEHDFRHNGQRLDVTVSVGVACTTGGEQLNTAGMLQQADDKLYAAKRAGRNQVRL